MSISNYVSVHNNNSKSNKFVYVLELEHDKFYVGQTCNLQERFKQHCSDTGSAWTKKYRPIGLYCFQTIDDTWEELQFTLKMMEKFGIQNVRGANYSNVVLTQEQTNQLEQMIGGINGSCLTCGKQGHFAKDCESIKTNSHSSSPSNKPNFHVNEVNQASNGVNLCDLESLDELRNQSNLRESEVNKASNVINLCNFDSFDDHNNQSNLRENKINQRTHVINLCDFESADDFISINSNNNPSSPAADIIYNSNATNSFISSSALFRNRANKRQCEINNINVKRIISRYWRKFGTQSNVVTSSSSPAVSHSSFVNQSTKNFHHEPNKSGFYNEDFHENSDANDDNDDDDNACFRCGRSSHWSSECYAKTDKNGKWIHD